ncbi:MAG: carbohydrate ABC transporter permease [Oscillospiraceae bacterium]|nr:carbohydrate ABC transporter permease [Oscillospiraceae bacterium]
MEHKSIGSRFFKALVYTVCITLGLMSVYPFFVMFLNATRSSNEIRVQAVPFLPSSFLQLNMDIITKSKQFNPMLGFRNSLIVAGGTVFCSIYFSCLTAYALTAYNWKMRQPFFTFIMAVMMIPGQIVTIGFYSMMWQLGFIDSYLPLILPAVASPTIVFFMRQYLLATFSLDIVNSARIDGAGEFSIFNRIVLPMMKPAIATQTIFVFVGSWNALFLPRVLLSTDSKFTMPIMVSLLRGNIYATEFGAIYLGISMSVIPIFIVYFTLSKYIISGIQLGGVKE